MPLATEGFNELAQVPFAPITQVMLAVQALVVVCACAVVVAALRRAVRHAHAPGPLLREVSLEGADARAHAVWLGWVALENSVQAHDVEQAAQTAQVLDATRASLECLPQASRGQLPRLLDAVERARARVVRLAERRLRRATGELDTRCLRQTLERLALVPLARALRHQRLRVAVAIGALLTISPDLLPFAAPFALPFVLTRGLVGSLAGLACFAVPVALLALVGNWSTALVAGLLLVSWLVARLAAHWTKPAAAVGAQVQRSG